MENNKQPINNGAKAKKRRRKGSGTILKKGGRYVLRWRDDGAVHQEATQYRVGEKGAKEQAEALLEERTKLGRLKERRDQVAVLLAEREELEAKIKRLEALATPQPQALTLGGLVEAWRKSPRRKDCSEAQADEYAREIAAFVRWAGEAVEMAAVDDAMAERYAAEMGARVSGNTYNKHLATLTAAWRAVARSAGVRANPWMDLPRKRKQTHSRRALTHEETDAILREATGELRALVLIGLRTGLRLGDAVRLEWSAFRGDGTVAVETHKTGALVQLPAQRLRGELAGGGDAPKEGLVVPGLAAMYERDPSMVCKRVAALFERAGIETREKRAGWLQARPTASYHSLRHTFVTRAIEAGVPAAIVRALVGHATAAMTDHYTHVGAAAIAEAFGRAGI